MFEKNNILITILIIQIENTTFDYLYSKWPPTFKIDGIFFKNQEGLKFQYNFLFILTFCWIHITAMTILLLILNTFYISTLFIQAADVALRKTQWTLNPEVPGLILDQDIFIKDTFSVSYTIFVMIDILHYLSSSLILTTDSCGNVISYTYR